MYYAVRAKIVMESEKGTLLKVFVPEESMIEQTKKFRINGVLSGELRIDDGRQISAEQRKKAYATLRDCADYLGYPPEELKELLKYDYLSGTGELYFSLSDCNMTVARQFITYILDFALRQGVPLSEPLIDRCDDIDAAIYATLKHKKCIVCGLDGEVHHWDAIGMGRDRDTVDDSLLRKICLCRKHHNEAHRIGRSSFARRYHVYGIIYNED